MNDEVFAAWDLGFRDATRLAGSDDPDVPIAGRVGLTAAERRMYDGGFDRAADIIRYERERNGQ